jgi:hypothetical protein
MASAHGQAKQKYILGHVRTVQSGELEPSSSAELSVPGSENPSRAHYSRAFYPTQLHPVCFPILVQPRVTMLIITTTIPPTTPQL